jgi:hypothetical protein
MNGQSIPMRLLNWVYMTCLSVVNFAVAGLSNVLDDVAYTIEGFPNRCPTIFLNHPRDAIRAWIPNQILWIWSRCRALTVSVSWWHVVYMCLYSSICYTRTTIRLAWLLTGFWLFGLVSYNTSARPILFRCIWTPPMPCMHPFWWVKLHMPG